MKKLSFLLILAVTGRPLQAEKTDTVKTVINSTTKSKKLSDQAKKVISGIAGAFASIILVGGSVYGYKKHQRRSNNLKQPLLSSDDDSDYEPKKSNELVLLLQNGKGTDQNIINALTKLIKEGADPNGKDDQHSIAAAIESGRSETIIEALLSHKATVSPEMVDLARQNNMDASIIKLLEGNNTQDIDPTLDGYVIIRGSSTTKTACDRDIYDSLAASSRNSSSDPLPLYPEGMDNI